MIVAFAAHLGALSLGWTLTFAPGFTGGMMDGGELAAYQGLPWGQDEIFQEAGATARQSAYTFGYTAGYCGEQVVAGALTGGAAVAGKLLFKETASQVGRLTLRSHFVTKSLLQHLKRTAKSALVAGVLRAEVKLGLRAAAKTPLSLTDKRTVAEVVENALARDGFNRVSAGMKFIMEEVGESPNIRKLFKTAGREEQFFHRLAIYFDTMGVDATEQATKGWIKTYERLLRFDGNVLLEDRADDFISFFRRANNSVETTSMRKSLEEYAVRVASEGPDAKFWVRDFDKVSENLYHYAPDVATRVELRQGQLVLKSSPNPRGRYVSDSSFTNAEEASRGLQLPDQANARYRLKISTVEVKSSLKLPKGAVNEAGYFEPLTRDFPGAGQGGYKQLLLEGESTLLEVFDTTLGRSLTQEEILILLPL